MTKKRFKEKPEKEDEIRDKDGNVLIFDSENCTKEQWKKILTVSLSHNNADLYVDIVILGMEKRFITEETAKRLLTGVEEFSPKRIH